MLSRKGCCAPRYVPCRFSWSHHDERPADYNPEGELLSMTERNEPGIRSVKGRLR
jgi:hypothetical protein